MAFNQPLVPVLPVARELIAKTKWVSSSKGHSNHPGPLKRKGTAKLLPFVGSSRKSLGGTRPTQSETTARELSSEDPKVPMPPMPPVPPLPSDAEQATEEQTRTRKRSRSRTRVLSLFKRKHHHESNLSRSSVDSDASVSVSDSPLYR